jgi:hypothetical protein
LLELVPLERNPLLKPLRPECYRRQHGRRVGGRRDGRQCQGLPTGRNPPVRVDVSRGRGSRGHNPGRRRRRLSRFEEPEQLTGADVFGELGFATVPDSRRVRCSRIMRLVP